MFHSIYSVSCLQGPVLRSKSPCVYKHSAEASTVHVSVTNCPLHDVSIHKPCVDHPFVVILRSLGFLFFNDLFLCGYFSIVSMLLDCWVCTGGKSKVIAVSGELQYVKLLLN